MNRHAAAAMRARPWGLRLADDTRAAQVERRWGPWVVLALLGTIPAFYAEMLDSSARATAAAAMAYGLAAATVAAALAHTALRCRQPRQHLAANGIDLLLVAGLLAAAALPASGGSALALGLRLAVSLLTLLRMLWAAQRLVTRGGLAYLLGLSVAVLALCGAGFWWLEPTTPTFGDGLWLAFTTAATVGYGDSVPTTPAAKIFAVFVVLLGFGVLTLVTAAIATSWIETEERRIEREILHDLRTQLGSVRAELAALRTELRAERGASERQPP